MANPLDIILNLRANADGFNQGVDGARFAVNALVSAMAALGVGLSAKSLLDTADQFTTLQAKIRVAVGDTGNFQQAMAGVYQVAIQTNSNLDDTANLFARLNDVGKQMGLSQQQVLEVTKTINQAVKVGGGTAESSSAAVTQLTQALQSGVLRGDEFNSIMEQAPGISKALAASLGVTTGELRKMAEEGKLSAETVVKALQGQAANIQSQYDQFPITVSNALQRISTAWTMLIGEMDQANGASTRVAEMLVYIADNLGELKKYFDDAANGVGYLVDKMQGIDPAVIDALKTALNSAYEATKQLAAQAVEGFEITIDVVDDALKAIFGFMTTAEQAEEGVSGFKKALDAVNIIIGLLRDGFSGISIAMSALTGLTYDIAAAWLNLRAKFSWGETKQQFIADAKEMAEKASKYYEDANTKIMGFNSATLEAGYEAQKTQAQINQEKIDNNQKTLSQIALDEQVAIADQQANNEKRKKLDADLVAARASNNQTAINTIMAQLSELDKSDDEFTKANIGRQGDKLKAVKDYVSNVVNDENKILDAKTHQHLLTLGYLVTQTEEQKKNGTVTIKALEDSSKAAEGFGLTASQAAKNAAKALGVDLDVALNQVSEGFTRTATSVDLVAAGFDELKKAGVNASDLVYAAWEKMLAGAKNQAEIEAAKQKLIDLGESGKIATKDVELGLQAIQDRAAKISPELSNVEAALKKLGITAQAEQAKMAGEYKQAFLDVEKSGVATAQSLKDGFEKYARAAIAANNGVVSATLQAEAAARGYTLEVGKSGNASVEFANKATTATSAVSKSADNTSRSVDRISNSFDRAGQSGVRAARSTSEAWDNTVTSLTKAAEKLDAMTKASGGMTGKDFMAKASGTKMTDDITKSLNAAGFTAYGSVEEIMKQMIAKGIDPSRAKVLASNLMKDQSWAKTSIFNGAGGINQGMLGFGAMSNSGYVDAEIKRLVDIQKGSPVKGSSYTKVPQDQKRFASSSSKSQQSADKIMSTAEKVFSELDKKLSAGDESVRADWLKARAEIMGPAEAAYESLLDKVAAGDESLRPQLIASYDGDPNGNLQNNIDYWKKKGKYEVYGKSGVAPSSQMQAPDTPMANIYSTLNRLAQSTTGQPAKNVNLKIDIGGVQAYIPTTQSGSDQAEALFRHLEDLKKGMY